MTRPIYDSEQLAASGTGMTPERAKEHCIISLVILCCYISFVSFFKAMH